MSTYIIYIIQPLFLLLLAPLFIGILNKTKACFRGYTGASIFQLYYDLSKLIKKGEVISASSSFVTKIGPLLTLVAAVSCAFVIPVFYTSRESIFGNIFVIFFTLGIIKFVTSLIGLDSASTFGGMGSSRELFISMLVEPIMFVVVTFLFIETKSFNIFTIASTNSTQLSFGPGHVLAALAFFILVLAENARMPLDNPETHLELTMVHEAMILDLSGKRLAFVELASAIKLVLFLTILINGFLPYGIAMEFNLLTIALALALYIVKIMILLFAIALLETTMAKFRLFKVPELLTFAFSIGIVSIIINHYM
ncbi:MAG TPA: hydrogenase [Clostridiales bacterium]|nr:MAG: hydrogenase [Clostridiales bacterium GWD2_32_19]HCC07599.1 hydrogenase [Clostridiales bacterium]